MAQALPRQAAEGDLRMDGLTRRWMAACALAEGIGIASAAAATRLTNPDSSPDLWPVLGGAAAAAFIEGSALGVLQGRVVRDSLAGVSVQRWWIPTVTVAFVGWTLGSVPATMASGGAEPSLWLVVLGAVGLGAAMGAVFGAAQRLAIRHLPGSSRWIWANVAGWAAAMPVIYLGASLPSASTPTAAVVVIGAAAGALAGAALGAVTGPALRGLSDASTSQAAAIGSGYQRRAS